MDSDGYKITDRGAERINHPDWYNQGSIEVIDFIRDQKLDFSLGNAVKYITRAAHKGESLPDLEKALWYIQDEIHRIKFPGLTSKAAQVAAAQVAAAQAQAGPVTVIRKSLGFSRLDEASSGVLLEDRDALITLCEELLTTIKDTAGR